MALCVNLFLVLSHFVHEDLNSVFSCTNRERKKNVVLGLSECYHCEPFNTYELLKGMKK